MDIGIHLSGVIKRTPWSLTSVNVQYFVLRKVHSNTSSKVSRVKIDTVSDYVKDKH